VNRSTTFPADAGSRGPGIAITVDAAQTSTGNRWSRNCRNCGANLDLLLLPGMGSEVSQVVAAIATNQLISYSVLLLGEC